MSTIGAILDEKRDGGKHSPNNGKKSGRHRATNVIFQFTTKYTMRYLAVFLLPIVVCSICRRARVRRSWDMMKKRGETELYSEAVRRAVDQGYQELFSEVHSEQGINTNEAHYTSGFVIWHRRYLLAYENMLRSLDPAFECLTIPYWNYFAHYAKIQSPAQQGDALAAAAIMREIPQGLARRNDWSQLRSFPSPTAIDFLSGVLNVGDYETVSKGIEQTFHNNVHGWLGATMGTYRSPSDPIFFSHHATVDLAHMLYLDCKQGRGKKSDLFKLEDPIAFVSFGRRGASPTVNSTFSMNHFHEETGTIPVEEHPKLKEFFQDLPDVYYSYIDSRDMGDLSYRYQYDPLLNNLFKEMDCVVQNTYDDDNDGNQFDIPDFEANVMDWREAILTMLKQITGVAPYAFEQLKIMHCVIHEKIFGLTDYTMEFRESFNLAPEDHAACIETVQKYEKAQKNHSSTIVLTDESWQKKFHEFFPTFKP